MPEAFERSGNFGAVGRLVDAVRSRPRLYRAARRAGRSRPARLIRSRVLRPTVSVIVPFYNVEAYLADCLDSILAQGYTDLEVLLVDDGSPDPGVASRTQPPVRAAQQADA